MAEPIGQQRLSFWGLVAIAVIGALIYFLMQSGKFFLIYVLVTLALCLLLLLVAFDIGIKKENHRG